MSPFEEMMKCIDRIQQIAKEESYTLTRDQEDQIFYNSQKLREGIKSIYNIK